MEPAVCSAVLSCYAYYKKTCWCSTWSCNELSWVTVINRLGVAGAVLQTSLSLINWLTDWLVIFLQIFRSSSIQNRKSKGAEILREGSSATTCHMSHVKCYMSCGTCQVWRVMCYLSCVTRHMSHVLWHQSCVTCRVSHIMCHISCVMFFLI